MKHFLYIFILAVVLLSSRCIDPPEYPDEPNIENIQINKNYIVMDQDSLIITFDFQDGNGDLGSPGNDSISLKRIDSRTGFEYPEYLPFVDLKGSSNDISGTIRLILRPGDMTCLPTPQQTHDTLSYGIYIIDRANNKSNVLYTPEFILECN